jgi:hypothetical protein
MSFRPFFSGLSLPFTSILGPLDAAYANHLHEPIPCDTSVYSRRRRLACVNGRKDAADLWLLTMERPDDNIRNYGTQAVADDMHMLGRMSTPPAADPLVASSPHQPATTFEDVAMLLPLIKRADDRDRWLHMGLALGGVCGRSPDGVEAYKDWSRGCARSSTRANARRCISRPTPGAATLSASGASTT